MKFLLEIFFTFWLFVKIKKNYKLSVSLHEKEYLLLPFSIEHFELDKMAGINSF